MADFMHAIMDLRHLFAGAEETTDDNGQGKDESGKEAADTQAQEETETKKIALKDWGEELKRRIKANAALDPETRSAEGDIRAKFWKDYFNSNWKPEVADKLLQIDLLEHDIEDIGFDPIINPYLAFLVRPFAQKRLLDGSLNSETFKGIHNAVSNEYIADSEFVKENLYNIIYRTDLYKQTPVDIEKYLSYQKEILSPSASTYTKKDMAKNLQAFLVNGITASKDRGAKLKELDEVKASIEKLTGKKIEDTSNTEEQKDDARRDVLIKIVKGLSSQAHLVAALQYVSMSTNAKSAKEALSKVSVSSITGAELVKATSFVAKLLDGHRLTKATADTFVELIQKKLKEI